MNAVLSLHSEYWIHNLVSLVGDCQTMWIVDEFLSCPHQNKKKTEKQNNKLRPKGIPSCVCKNFVTVALEYLHDRCQPVIKQLKSVYKKQATTTTTTRTKGNEIYLCICVEIFCCVFWASETSEKCVACLLASVGWTIAFIFCFLDWIKVPQEDLQREPSEKYFLFRILIYFFYRG